MFTSDGNINSGVFEAAVSKAGSNYCIQVEDFLEIEVYTNNGELIIDPNMELRKDLGGQQSQGRKAISPSYLVQSDGTIKLPMVGIVQVEGFTLLEVDSILENNYNNYYESVFVITKVQNRRVTVLGPLGGKVVPLPNENMNLIEVLALYGGIDNNSKAHNIRLIRGELDNPSVQIVNLTTIEGMKKASLQVKTNDIIYIEPVRKVVSETVKDVTPIVSMFTSLVTLIIVITR